jgi:ABC-2 type transport system ATP-binding protein
LIGRAGEGGSVGHTTRSEGKAAGAQVGTGERSDATPVVELRGLRKSFRGHLGLGRTVAVENLEMRVRTGEIFGLLGPNGAGKTTTFKMMLGLLRPDRGEVRLFGRPPSEPAVRARLGYLPENPYFYDYLTAEEFLDLYGRLQGIPTAARRARIREILRRVGLEGRERTALRKFSKGMVQRLGLAQAIQHDPELVILDEPMSGLDPIGRREVRDLILSLRAAGRTVLFSSHILQDAEVICDRVAILDRGRLRSIGRLDEMISSQVEWFEVAVRGSMRTTSCATLLSRDGGLSLWRVPDVDALAEFMVVARESGAAVSSVWPKRKTLEDLFLREIGAGGSQQVGA